VPLRAHIVREDAKQLTCFFREIQRKRSWQSRTYKKKHINIKLLS